MRRLRSRYCAALNINSDRIAAQRYILLFGWIEIRKCEKGNGLLLFIRREDHFESLRAADSNLVIILELGRRRIFMPTAVIFHGRRINTIEITPSGNYRCDSNRIAYLHTLWLRFCRHCEIPDRTRKARRSVWWQRFDLECHGFTVDLNLAPLAELAEWFGKKRVGEWVVEIKQIKR